MSSMMHRPKAVIRHLLRAQGGLAMTEFAMALPILLTLGLAGMEIAQLMLAHLRVSNIAMITADNASRVRDSIDEGDISQIFLGSTMAGASIDFAQRGRIVLSSLERTPTGDKQWIRWQRCIGSKAEAPSYGRPKNASGTEIKDGTEQSAPSSPASFTMTAMGPPGNQIAAQAGTAVMVAEVTYDYRPLLLSSLLNNMRIRYVSAFNVRQRTNQVLSNSSNITRAACN